MFSKSFDKIELLLIILSQAHINTYWALHYQMYMSCYKLSIPYKLYSMIRVYGQMNWTNQFIYSYQLNKMLKISFNIAGLIYNTQKNKFSN